MVVAGGKLQTKISEKNLSYFFTFPILPQNLSILPEDPNQHNSDILPSVKLIEYSKNLSTYCIFSLIETRKPCVTPNRRYSQVKYFLLFIGYARSGSTLMGSLLDAHPNMIVANEYGLAKKFATFNQSQKTRRYIFHQLFKNSIQEATAKQRSPSFAGLFNYHVHDQWQGKFNCSIQVGSL